MNGDRRTVVVTGASGVVGRAVAEELRDDCHVIGLVGSDHNVPEAHEVVPIDLRADRLGLTASVWSDLAARADSVVHSAALTEWGRPREVYQEINIDGTRRVLALAEEAGAPLHYVGTCFVHAIERGGFDDLAEDNVVRPYIWSKLECEALLGRGDAPFSVFRPTNLVGDSRTGASSRPQIVQALSEWICRGRAPFVPVHPGNRIDVVALDTCAQAVAAAVRQDAVGDVWWVTQGADAMSVERSLDILVEHARLLGREIERPPVVDAREPLPIPLERIPTRSRAFVKVLLDVSEVTHWCGGVLPDSNDALTGRLGLELPSDETSYALSLRYWARERGQLPMTEEEVTHERV